MRVKRAVKQRTKKASLREREKKEQRQDQILSAAFEEFSVNGYAGARLDDVARRGGMAKGTIYLYYKNKEQLFRAVVRSVIRPVFENLDSFVGDFSGSAEDLLRAILCRQYGRVVKNERARAVLRMLIAESGKFPELSDVFHREIIGPGVAALRTLLQKGVASGELRKSKIMDFPQILISPGVMAVLWILILGKEHRLDLDAYMDAHLEFVLYGLKKHV
jgi:AcrR family transcriptional regulator